MLRRLVILGAIAASSFAVAAPAAVAKTTDALDREVTGSFAGTTAYEFGAAGCSFVHQVFDLTYDTARGSGTLHMEGCATSDGTVAGGFRYDLDFVLTTPSRATLTGTATGGVFPMDLTLTVERGTKRFSHVSGTIDLDGVWTAPVLQPGTASGTLAGHLRR